jgi:hypothetical protein
VTGVLTGLWLGIDHQKISTHFAAPLARILSANSMAKSTRNQMEFDHEISSGISNETARKHARKINAESFERRILTSDTRGLKSTLKLKRCFVRSAR